MKTLSIALLLGLAVSQNCPQVTIRKDVYDVTEEEWKIIIDTIKLAAKTPDPRSENGASIWEEAAELHSRLTDQIHMNCVFFPWHRLFILDVEKKLQKLNPKFFFPYWDSAREWDKADESIVWQKFGTNSNPIKNCLFGDHVFPGDDESGPLKRGGLKLNKELITRETYNEKYQRSLTNGGFKGWAEEMETLHGTVHVMVGGEVSQLSTSYSPLDPIFYIHHAYIDFLWVNAQAGWKENGLPLEAQIGGLDIKGQACTAKTKMPGYKNDFGSLLETENLCVEYTSPGQGRSVPMVLAQVDHPNVDITSTVTQSISSPASSSSADAPEPSDVASQTSLASGNTSIPIPSASIEISATGSSAAHPTSFSVLGQAKLKSNGTSDDITEEYDSDLHPSPTATEALVSEAPSASPTVASSVEGSLSTKATVVTTTVESGPAETLAPIVPYGYGQNYTPIDTCFKPLPDYWIKMNSKNKKSQQNIKEIQERLLKICQQTVEKVKSGEEIKPMPLYKPEAKPLIVEPSEKPVEPQDVYHKETSNGMKNAAAAIFFAALAMLLQ